MAGNYQKGMYNQLMEVMERLDTIERDLHTEKREHKEDVKCLSARIDELTQENQLLRDDNARLKSIINNDSSNTSLPPSTDQKEGKPANTYNGREKSGRRTGGQTGTMEQPLPKLMWKKKLNQADAGMKSGKSEIRPAINISRNTSWILMLQQQLLKYISLQIRMVSSIFQWNTAVMSHMEQM